MGKSNILLKKIPKKQLQYLSKPLFSKLKRLLVNSKKTFNTVPWF